jgi:uncharacterized protein with NRDE domain
MKTPNKKQRKTKFLIEDQPQNIIPSEKEQQQQQIKTPDDKQQQCATPKSSTGTEVNVMLHYIIILPSDTFTTKCLLSLSVVHDSCIIMLTFLLFSQNSGDAKL